MTTRDFAYWLQGFFEISKATSLDDQQVQMVKNHLNLVFLHDIDPSEKLTPQQEKKANQIHSENITGREVIGGREILPDGTEVIYRC